MSTTNPKTSRIRGFIDFSIASVLAVILFFGYNHFYISSDSSSNNESASIREESPQLYGFDLNEHYVGKTPIKNNQFLADILLAEGVSFETITSVESASKDIYSTRRFKAGKELTLIRKDICDELSHFIYEPDPFRYIVYDLTKETPEVKEVLKEFEICEEIATGKISESLWLTMVDNGLNPALIDKMEDALASQVDFYHTKNGDEFKIIYEQKYIDDKPVSIGNIIGAYYKKKNNGQEAYSFHYKTDKYDGYYDLEARASKGAFLRSPVKASRISSRYNLRRFHPIKKRRIPHRGTDYAAPRGTPIRAVANGVVTHVSFTRNNGKYVKIKHDKTYQTQYLHMSKFAKGVRSGTTVKQGQTIGYVGSTGLATGPHVCFRFWKNGVQVDPLREILPPSDPMADADKPAYLSYKEPIRQLIDGLEISEPTKKIFVMNDSAKKDGQKP